MHISGHTPSLPEPSADALALSQRLLIHIRDAIAAAGGWLPFVEYEALALYAPGMGYYSNGSVKLGQEGDFTTAPELSTLFGQTLARQVADILPHTGRQIIECGPGSGKLALDLLRELERLDCLPESYALLEVSGDLRERQQQRFAEQAPQLLPRLRWLDQLPEQIDGVVLGNEVLDAIPTHLLRWEEDGVHQLGVVWRDDALQLAARPLTDADLLAQAEALPVDAPYQSEVQWQAAGFVRTLAERLQRGVILLIDYGFPQREYYHPQRDSGTLMCHYRHHAHPDPLWLPGLQDITTHVDFTAMALAGVEQGLELAGYTSQALFLANAGITELLQEADQTDLPRWLPLANQAQRLMSPAEMGELFKVLALSRHYPHPLRGFAMGDRSHTL